jgi:hypothetical protein
MMTKTTRRRLTAIAAMATGALIGLAGCELAVDFDRTKIDAGTIDASIPDTGGDTTVPDDANADVVDGGNDADAQPATDGNVDAGPDADDGAADADAE